MSSMFDSNVYRLRRQIDFVRPNFLDFVRAKAMESEEPVVFEIRYRHAVASRFWYELTWNEPGKEINGRTKKVSSQEFDLMLWRAIQVHREVSRKRELEEASAEFDEGAGI